ncbi:MAG: hypothetical protein LBK25_07815 [Treponema sp.]|nr:hypothetical protein [Treponema sp.]
MKPPTPPHQIPWENGAVGRKLGGIWYRYQEEFSRPITWSLVGVSMEFSRPIYKWSLVSVSMEFSIGIYGVWYRY